MNKVRVGFVGCGGMAKAHADAMAGFKDIEIVAVTDIRRETAEAFVSTRPQATIYDTPLDIVDAGIDCLFLLIPPYTHGAPEQVAISRGIPFFVEKPVGLDPDLIRKLAREVEDTHLLTAAGYMNRYRRSVTTAREMLTVDAAILGTGGWLGGTPGPAQGTQIGSWWTNKAKSGGQFHEQVTHTVDIARYLFGTAVSVSAFGATGFNCNIPGYATDDAAVVNIQFENGSIVNVLASVSSNAAGGVFLNVYARNVAFEFTGWEHSVKIRRKGEGEGGIIKGEDNIFSIEDRVFIDAVKSGDKSAIKSTYPDAAKTALVSIGANQSMANGGRPVDLKES